MIWKRKKINPSLNFFVSILFVLLMAGCSSTKSLEKSNEIESTISIESGEIPPDMQDEKFGLIGVLRGRKSIDKYIAKKFLDYTGDYVLVPSSKVDSVYQADPYYRYRIDFTSEMTMNNHIRDTFYILDIKTGEIYTRLSGSSFYAYELKIYLQAIERYLK